MPLQSKFSDVASIAAWEGLVTEGHIHAIRIRRTQPWLIASAVVMILVGVYLALIVRHSTSGRYDEAAASMSDPGAPVRAAVAGMPPLDVRPDEGQQMAPFNQIAPVVPILLQQLEQDGQLGTSTVKVAQLSPDDFWRKPWPHSSLVGTGTGDVRLVGAVANMGSVGYASGTRWLGVFSKRGDGHWKFLSAAEPAFSQINGQPAAPLEVIPQTLGPVLPSEE